MVTVLQEFFLMAKGEPEMFASNIPFPSDNPLRQLREK
jgi:hypothetical protein